MRARIVVIPPNPAENDPLSMFEVLENDAAYTFPLESRMKALLSSILIAGVPNGGERLDERVLSDKLNKSPGTILGTFI